MDVISTYFLYFIIYAFLGWLMEVICKLVEKHKFINRGFLVGPICPIYGYGVLFIVLLIGRSKGDILAVFLKSILVCSVLEYLTSYFMERLFNARWWDYSRRKFNLNGRICLETMLPFGLLGVFVIYILHPLISSIVLKLNSHVIIISAVSLFIIYIFDNIFSYFIMNRIKHEINDTDKDNTEAIKVYINSWLNNNSVFYRRLKNAYPNFIIKLKDFEEKARESRLELSRNINELKDEYKKTKKELRNSYKQNKLRIKNNKK